MKLKTAVRIIRYSNIGLVIALLPFIAAFFTGTKSSQLLTLYICVAGIGVILFIFRYYAVRWILRNSAYPGVVYAVLDKLKLADKLDLTLSDELLDDLYNPAYPTEQFLADNKLSTRLGYVLSSGHYRTQFTKEGVSFLGQVFLWEKIFDWQFVDDNLGPGEVTIFYYDEKGNDRQSAIPLSAIDTNAVDMLLLLTHFKGKYGSPNNQTALPD